MLIKWFSDYNWFDTKISEGENKIPNASSLVATTVLNTKVTEFENKIPDHDPRFNKLPAENFAARLKQANLVTKTDFDNKLTSFNRKIISNKTKYLEVHKNLNSLILKDYYAEFILQVMMDLKTCLFINQHLIL